MIDVAEVFNYFFLAFYSAEFLIKIALQLGEFGLESPPGNKTHTPVGQSMYFARMVTLRTRLNDFHLLQGQPGMKKNKQWTP